MSCYVKNLEFLFEELGIENNPQNQRLIDRTVRLILGMEEDNCNDVWARLKELLDTEEGKIHLIAEVGKEV